MNALGHYLVYFNVGVVVADVENSQGLFVLNLPILELLCWDDFTETLCLVETG